MQPLLLMHVLTGVPATAWAAVLPMHPKQLLHGHGNICMKQHRLKLSLCQELALAWMGLLSVLIFSSTMPAATLAPAPHVRLSNCSRYRSTQGVLLVHNAQASSDTLVYIE